MNSSTNPLIRPQTPFERRLVGALESSKPGRSVGLSNRPLPGGASLALLRRQSAPSPARGLHVTKDGKVTSATVMSVEPTIGGTRLDAATPPALSIPTTGTQYVIVTIAGTFDLKASTFVLPTYTAAPTVTITVDTTDPGFAGTHAVSSGTFKFVLATFVNGKKTAQKGHGPITAEICDNLKAEAKANLNITWAES